MQSGITASADLQAAFRTLTSSSDQRALLATISDESLIPTTTIPLSSTSLGADLDAGLQRQLSPTKAAYVLLKTHPGAADGYAAVTFIPNAAGVREKMLFAATRLTLVRELGIERFRETVLVTEAEELTAAGWARHEKSRDAAPAAALTKEESGLIEVKEAEARESQGTGGRRGHVTGRVDVPTGEGVVEALRLLGEEGCRGTLVQLKFALPDETLLLDSSTDNVTPAQVAATISPSEPRYSFYSHPAGGGGGGASSSHVIFIYTCPTSSRIKERMVYSTGKSWTRIIAERDAELSIAKSMEASDPSELTEDVLGTATAEVDEAAAAEKAEQGKVFARPKRPGRR